MTTITFRDGIIACDSCWSDGGTVSTLQSKIMRLSSGALLGSAGACDSRDIESLLDKIKTPAALPTCAALGTMRLDYAGLLIFPKGARIFKIICTGIDPSNWDGTNDNEEFGLWEINMPFAAIGSGTDLAIGAMAAGKSARDAVSIAARFDMYSKPPVHSLGFAASVVKPKRGRT